MSRPWVRIPPVPPCLFILLTLDCHIDEDKTNYSGRLSTGWRAVESKLFSSILERVGKLGPVVAAEKYPKTIGVKTCFIGDSSERRAFSSARTMVVQISFMRIPCLLVDQTLSRFESEAGGNCPLVTIYIRQSKMHRRWNGKRHPW